MNTHFLQPLRNRPPSKGSSIEPIGDYGNIGIPGVKCDRCGQTWATSIDHISRDLPIGHYLWEVQQSPVSPLELQVIADDVRMTLALPNNYILLPGTRISVLRFRYLREAKVTCEWPIINTLIISEAMKDFWESNHFTGWYAEPVITVDASGGDKDDLLFEVSITGIGGSAITYPVISVISECNVCGKIEYNLDYAELLANQFALNEAEWDGTDLFRFNPPFNGRIATSERFRKAMDTLPSRDFDLPLIQQEMSRIVENQRMLKPRPQKY